MKRASWWLAFYDPSKKAIARNFGAIPAYLRQSRAARGVCRPCAGDGGGTAGHQPRGRLQSCGPHVHLPIQKQLAASQVKAGVLLSSYGDPNRPNVKEVRWVRSHRDLDQATSAEEKQEVRRNDVVDALAKAALQCRDDDTWEWAKQRARLEKTWMIAQTLGATLALWPKLGRVWLRSAAPNVATTPGRRELRRQQPHKWVFERRAWRCTLCSRVAKGRSQRNKPVPGKCPDTQNIEHHDRFRLEAQRHGHIIWGFPWNLPFFYCVRCGAHARWWMRRLAQQCKGRPACDSGAAASQEDSIPEQERAWRRERQLTCSCTDM